jgi:hypothetical protein
LGHDIGFFQAGQALYLLGPADHVAAALRVAHQAQHLGVVGVTDYYRGIALGGVLGYVLLDMLDQRAGGVHYLQVQGADAGFFFGRDAVRADDQDGALLFDLGGRLYGQDILFFEGFYDLLVVDERSQGVDGPAALAGQFFIRKPDSIIFKLVESLDGRQV